MQSFMLPVTQFTPRTLDSRDLLLFTNSREKFQL